LCGAFKAGGILNFNEREKATMNYASANSMHDATLPRNQMMSDNNIPVPQPDPVCKGQDPLLTGQTVTLIVSAAAPARTMTCAVPGFVARTVLESVINNSNGSETTMTVDRAGTVVIRK
jgi:hypothetical protein